MEDKKMFLLSIGWIIAAVAFHAGSGSVDSTTEPWGGSKQTLPGGRYMFALNLLPAYMFALNSILLWARPLPHRVIQGALQVQGCGLPLRLLWGGPLCIVKPQWSKFPSLSCLLKWWVYDKSSLNFQPMVPFSRFPTCGTLGTAVLKAVMVRTRIP